MLAKKENMSKYNIIQIIFKCCVSKIYLTVLSHNIERVYDQIDMNKK